MEKFINGGIAKEITDYFKKKEDKVDALDHLSNYVNLDLYDMEDFEDCFYLELKEEVLRKNILLFLEELEQLGIYDEEEMKDKMDAVSDNLKNGNYECVLDHCDEVFKDRYRMVDQFSFYNGAYDMDILYYAFYFDGPYPEGEFGGLLKYMHALNKKVIQNPLGGSLCFGIN